MSDKKQEIAEILKTQRENLGLSIDDIYEHTRINPEFIKVLEAGQFELLPVAYARLFLKTYAQALNLNVRDILSRFERSVALPRERVTAPPSPERGINRSAIFISLLAFAVIAVVIIILNSREETPPTAPLDTTTSPLPIPDSTESVISTEQISISEEDMLSGMQDSAKSVQEMQLRDSTESVMPSLSENQMMPSDIVAETPAFQPAPVVLSTYNLSIPGVIAEGEIMILSGVARETAHLSITADDRGVFAGVLPVGRQQRWLAYDRFQVQIQRASSISFSLQDQPLEFASPPDRGLRLTIFRTLVKVEELGDTPSAP
ncbi:MAG: helix-turn-helix domain-containing protein [Gemmatimonadetes bacterium]|nr:helix-turn-helix domain-containing protein [Gemmatimonadota bacterium]